MPTDPAPAPLVAALRTIVGPAHVLTGEAETRRFRSGYRYGEGPVIAVVRPGSLVEQWRIVRACVAADVSIILQASNTGLTGGSTPDGAGYPGGVVLISTTRIAGVHVIDGGQQVVCLPGATLYELERTLKPYEREPHSVIGSSCIGASVLGGVCNNSGGSLVQRGPAFTQLALYAAIRPDGGVDLVNHLGIAINGTPEEVLAHVERGGFDPAAIAHDPERWAHDRAYADHVRQVDADTPARFNADPRCLFEGSGSAGKLVLFAVRLDTFPRETGVATFYIGTNDPMQLTRLRREILGSFESLPIAGEYIHRTAFDIAAIYGKDTFLAIQRLGTDRLPGLFALKAKVDTLVGRLRIFGDHVSDHVMQFASRLFPHHLPRRMRDYRDRFEHHLMLKMPAAAIEQTRALLGQVFSSGEGAFFECTGEEATKAFLHRFAAAGAAIRYREIHRQEVEDIVALDIALPRNERDWMEILPPEIEGHIIHKLYYGHFFCHVFHQDYIVRKGVDPIALEHRMWHLLDDRGAEYPAEHNVGHLYKAKPALADFYRGLDPRNQLNPGIGQTTKQRFWGEKAG
ncbi:D-lactate dehydrogenase [Sphingomonas sp.]|uniref:D-lactate dehydrogenase n=1 Tax=Sphingomonas sp. TaxID=28214 RepID=UPI0025CC8FBC|nr:D-lactate dehydrogenase [Sphingomonas sp.]